jgi:WD40 repeat protein/energy-coupling factor transporter ATP-binding protein EcfA2
VPLYDYWRDPQGAYLIMRLMKGGSLEAVMHANGSLEGADAARLVDQIASALDTAHQQGVVHRDLKPANILLDEDGNAYLSDFGIAKELGAEAEVTQTGAILGTPAYITPEQVQSRSVSPQTDIYALGVMLYELFVGDHPFPEATSAELVVKHLQEPLPYVRECCPDLPAALDGVIQKATAKDPSDRYATASALAEDLRRALQLDIDIPEVPLGELYNPYKGLRAFQEADSDDFFGREALTGQLLAKLAAPGLEGKFLAVIGPSGSGKSSVVKAGLLPALRKGALPGSDQWYIVELHPGAQPLKELELALLSISADSYVQFEEILNQDRTGLLKADRIALPGEESQLLLVIDQFEELFSLVQDEGQRIHFLESLYSAVTEPGGNLRVVITLRADFYDKPLMHPEFGQIVEQRTAVVLPLSPGELESAVRRPAERVGAVLEEGLVSAITSDVVDQPGALPLLQYALTELFERREGRMLTCQSYQDIGGVLGALGRKAEEVYVNLDEAGEKAARQLFLRLVTLGEGAEDTRRRVSQAELEALSPIPSPTSGKGLFRERSEREEQEPAPDSLRGVRAVLDAFGRARLLTFDHDPDTREPTVEVAHEALLQEWRRLRTWLDDSRADIRMQRVLGNAAQEWLSTGRETGYLLRETRLDQFEAWAATTDVALTHEEKDYLETSLTERRARQAEEEQRLAHETALERRSRNFLRGLVGVLAVATIVAVVLTIFAFNQRGEAQNSAATAQAEAIARATQQERAESEADQRATQQAIAEGEANARGTAEAIAIEERDKVLRQASVALAGDALEMKDLGDAELAVLLTLAALQEYPYTPQAEKALAESVIEVPSARLVPGGQNISWQAVAWSPTGNRIATAVYGGNLETSILIQDPITGIELLNIALRVDCYTASNVAWSPSGDRIIVVPQYCDYDPRVFDASSGELLISLESQPGQSNFSAAWSPDGTAILTGSQDGTARLWDSQTGHKQSEIPAHRDYITQVAWSPGGEYLATASLDDTARIWDAETGELQHELGGFSDDVSGLAWSPDGEKIVAVSLDARAQVWDTETGELIMPLIGHEDQILDVAWSPGGGYIASDSRDGTARIWDANTGRKSLSFSNNRSEEAALNSIDWSPDGDRLLVMGSEINQIWDLSAQPPLLIGHLEGLQAAAWSPDGGMIATASLDGTARIWDAARGELLATLSHSGGVEDLVWSPDGEQLTTADQAGSVRIWEVDAESYTELSNPDEIRFSSLAWSPGGDRIVASSQSDQVSLIWEVNTGEIIELGQGDLECFLSSPSWSPGGDQLVTGCVRRELKDTPARIWDAATGQELARLEGTDGNSLVVGWSPDGTSIAVAYSEMVIRTWDAESARPTTRYSGHADIIADLGWSPNSQRLVSADGGGFVKVWGAATGDEIQSIKMKSSLNSVSWSPDGEYVIAATFEPEPGIYRAWQSTQALIDFAEGCCAWRELTIGERQQFGLPLE